MSNYIGPCIKVRCKTDIHLGDLVKVIPEWNAAPYAVVIKPRSKFQRFKDWLFSCKQKRYIPDRPFGVCLGDVKEGDYVVVSCSGSFSVRS